MQGDKGTNVMDISNNQYLKGLCCMPPSQAGIDFSDEVNMKNL